MPPAMPPISLELNSIDLRHPGPCLLHYFGAATIHRLSMNPKRIAPGLARREVILDLASPHRGVILDLAVDLGWGQVTPPVLAAARVVHITVGDTQITEHAAIGVVAMLIHEFERGVIQTVIQIGSSADYSLRLACGGTINLEVGGNKADPKGGKIKFLLKKKAHQVLTGGRDGFAGVATFCHLPKREVRCKIAYVTRPPGGPASLVAQKKAGGPAAAGTIAMESAPPPILPDVISRLSSAGNLALALAVGDTDAAAESFSAAAEKLLSQPDEDPPARQYNKLLAATQFYLGGKYAEVAELSNGVDEDLLDRGAAAALMKLRRDAEERASRGYEGKVRARAVRQWGRGDFRAVLRTLAGNQYAYGPAQLSLIRGMVCAELRDWESAAFFYGGALRRMAASGKDAVVLGILALATDRVERLRDDGAYEEGLVYIDLLRGSFDHPALTMAASVIRRVVAESGGGGDLLAEQIDLFRRGWAAYHGMPEATRLDARMRAAMSVCFDAAIRTLYDRHEYAEAASVATDAIAFDPASPLPLIARGALRYLEGGGESDFAAAAAMPNSGYAPLYFLSLYAYDRRDYAAAERLCVAAMGQGPTRQQRATLLTWLAVLKDMGGADPGVAAGLYEQAFAADPSNELAHEAYSLFKSEGRLKRQAAAGGPSFRAARAHIESGLLSSPGPAPAPRRPSTTLREMLQAVG